MTQLNNENPCIQTDLVPLCQRWVQVIFDDLETGMVLATVPKSLTNVQIVWIFQYLHDKLADDGVYEDQDPSVALLCRVANQTFYSFTFTEICPDATFQENGRKVTCVPPFLTVKQRGVLRKLILWQENLHGYYPYAGTIVDPAGVIHPLKEGLAMLWEQTDAETIRQLTGQERLLLCRTLESFEIIESWLGDTKND